MSNNFFLADKVDTTVFRGSLIKLNIETKMSSKDQHATDTKKNATLFF